MRLMGGTSGIQGQALRIAGASVFAALGIYVQGLESDVSVAEEPRADVVIVAEPISKHAKLDPSALRVRGLSPDVLPANTLSPADFSQLEGLVARRNLRAGQVLTLHDLTAPPRAETTSLAGAHVRVPLTQIQGIGPSDGRVKRDLYGAGVTLYGAWIEAVEGEYRISVPAGDAEDLARLARQSALALECAAQRCHPLPPAPVVAPVKTRKPSPKTSQLRVSYGLTPEEQP